MILSSYYPTRKWLFGEMSQAWDIWELLVHVMASLTIESVRGSMVDLRSMESVGVGFDPSWGLRDVFFVLTP